VSDQIGFLQGPTAAPPPRTVSAVIAPHPGPQGFIGEPLAEGPIQHLPAAVLGGGGTARLAPAPLTVAAIAGAGLAAALLLLSLGNFVADQFARAAPLGIATLAVLLAAGGALGWAAWREWRGLAQLRVVDGLRADLASEDPARVREAALAWCAGNGVHGAQAAQIMQAESTAAIRAFLDIALAPRDAAATLRGREAALQVLTATAISPWPGLDGLIVVWRGARLVREVAQGYGLRPGTLGTLALFHRVAIDAGTVAAADIAVGAMVESFAHDAVLSRLLGQAAGAATATRRMLRLARAVADACRPVPRAG